MERDDGDAVTFAVHNGGAPDSTDALPVVFEPFARGHAESTGKASAYAS